MPGKNDLHYIYNSWCPEMTKDVNHLKQKRPIMKEILKQSINGTLQIDGFPNTIVNKKEFKILWNEVHGDIDPVITPLSLPKAETKLKNLEIPVETHIREGLGHGIDAKGIEIGKTFLHKNLQS